jgi:hypothetical protein
MKGAHAGSTYWRWSTNSSCSIYNGDVQIHIGIQSAMWTFSEDASAFILVRRVCFSRSPGFFVFESDKYLSFASECLQNPPVYRPFLATHLSQLLAHTPRAAVH